MSGEMEYIKSGFIRNTGVFYPKTLLYYPGRIKELIRELKPGLVSLEAPKNNRGFSVTQKLTEMIGCIKMVCMETQTPFIEIIPSSMKKIITGNGWASKEEVARTLSDRFEIPYEELVYVTYYIQGLKKGQVKSYITDASDALGLAVCTPEYLRRTKKLDYDGK